MKRNSDLRNTWSSCVMQMLKRQTRVKGAVSCVSIQGQCIFLNMIKDHSHVYLNKKLFLLYNLFFLGSKLRPNSSVVRIPAFWTHYGNISICTKHSII